jgi:lysophospholipase L1-like esterase
MKVYGTDAYSEKLQAYVDKITRSGSKAIILSSVTRRNFDREGKITPRVIQGRSLQDYARSAELLAREKKAPFIDLYARSVEHHNEIGPTRSATYNPDKSDKTHLNSHGAQAIAGLVIDELNRVVPELAPYVD